VGAFEVSLVAKGRRLVSFLAPNVLTYEGIEHVYRQMFIPFGSAMSFAIGVAGPTLRAKEDRPNPESGTVEFGPLLEMTYCTDGGSNEGGGYTSGMRTSFGYARQAVGFTASQQADGGAIVTAEVEFPNDHAWTPQDGDDWDLPWTTDKEMPPPEWNNRIEPEPIVGYPWQSPRKRCMSECNPEDPNECVYSYWHTWDPTGGLDWLCDFRKVGGFPITLAFLFESNYNKLLAAAAFREPVLLRPGLTLKVTYKGRIFGK
jgi:hypothetical protein